MIDGNRKLFLFIPASVLFMVVLWWAKIPHMDVFLIASVLVILAFAFVRQRRAQRKANEEAQKRWDSLSDKERSDGIFII